MNNKSERCSDVSSAFYTRVQSMKQDSARVPPPVPLRLSQPLLLLPSVIAVMMLVYLFCSSTRCWQRRRSLSHASEALKGIKQHRENQRQRCFCALLMT